ncbi:type IX secretion system plug protein [Salegentibacter chungangensis]|uniref:DUF5103 domain-containing protein n=1 Tax=Salegentibacter chungangensis TaxID=1335724 RepID=A0ABW3NR54_9FLAO
MRTFLLLILFFQFPLHFLAQEEKEVLPPNYIRSIKFHGDSLFQNGNPILRLGETINLSFDDIIGDEANYYYTIEHFNYDWTPSQLAKSEYLNGFDDIRIFNYQNSYNTLQPYSHYELQIPNEDTKGLKVSGNYMLKIFNENDELVFSRKFMVYENLARVPVEVKRARDLKYIDTRQVVNFSVESPNLLLKNPDQTVNVVIIQNYNLKTAIKNIQPQYTIANDLIYKYDQETSFPGGNEFMQFDNKDLRATTIDINYIEVKDLYHHFLFPDAIRSDDPYTYNPDLNGGFLINSIGAQNPDIEAEYIWMHFKLQDFQVPEGSEVHLYGNFNNYTLDNSTRLSYNPESGYFETGRLFKQGYYNYKYIVLKQDGTIDEGVISGNFDETENQYQVLVYYTEIGGRYDRIIGIGQANSKNIRN